MLPDMSSPETPLLSVVVPVFREEAAIEPFLARLEPVLAGVGTHEILFCLDPSPDGTAAVIERNILRNPAIGLLVFSRRFGQPAATMAGILHCRGRHCVVIDVDLQDPPELIPAMLARAAEGFDVVTARRRSRKGETTTKLIVAHLGYKLLRRLAEVDIPSDTGDFRIVSRRVIEQLRRMPEHHGFLRGLVAYAGFPQVQVEYDRDERGSGEGKYNRFLGSMRIALNGVVGFSSVPLSAMMWGGALVALASAVAALAVVLGHLGGDMPGWPLVSLLVLFVGGVQLAGIGLLGEYVGRIFDEVRGRPRFIVERTVNVHGISDGGGV
jgi:dolichol-phosphate mannosyltransferase